MSKVKKVWHGQPPVKCDLCGTPITNIFIDGNTSYGWANMCPTCHAINGKGLGIGKGQQYKLNKTSKEFVKVGV